MKKQGIEIGLEYIKKLGIRAAKDRNAIKKELEDKIGKKDSEFFFYEFNNLCNKGDLKSYDYKNSDYTKSIIFTGGFDAYTIRKCCNWIDENKDSFGNKILDVGCDCGFMTCFLGLAFPDSTILSIDREENGIKVAKQLAEKLGINNITFKHIELSELEENEFDTVFSMRTATENGLFVLDPDNDFMSQADSFKSELSDYGKNLASKVKDGGSLITIEMMGKDAFMAGWLEALYDAGLSGDINQYKEIASKEVGNTVYYQTFVLKKEQPKEKGMDFFLKLIDKIGCYHLGEFRDWPAKLIYETKKGELFDGYKVYGQGTKSLSIFSLWSVKDDPDKLLFYQNHEGNPIVQLHKINKKNHVEKTINNYIETAKKYSTLKIEKL